MMSPVAPWALIASDLEPEETSESETDPGPKTQIK